MFFKNLSCKKKMQSLLIFFSLQNETIYKDPVNLIYNAQPTLTCISSRHSQKFELDGIRWKQKLNWHSRVKNKPYFQAFFSSSFFLISSTVKAFDLIPKLRARSKYQVSSGTKSPHILLLYLVWLKNVVSITFFWLCAAVVTHP